MKNTPRHALLGAAVMVFASCSGSTDTTPAPDYSVVAERDGDVWIFSGDGASRKPIIEGLFGAVHYPMCSPDRRQIAYEKTVAPNVPAETFVVNADGTPLKTISGPGGIYGPVTWSPDGKHLAGFVYDNFVANPDSQIQPTGLAIVNSDGSGFTRIRGTDSRPIEILDPLSWSPDGIEILYTSASFFDEPTKTTVYQALWAVNVNSGITRQVMPEAMHGRWSPDGQRIAYIETNPNLAPTLVTINRDGSSRHVVMPGEGAPTAFTWSADGKRIIFSRYTSLEVVSADGGIPAAFSVDGSISETQPHWCGTP